MTTKIEALLQVDANYRQNVIDYWDDRVDGPSIRKTSLNLTHQNDVLIEYLLGFSEDDQLYQIAGETQSQIMNNLLQLGFEKMKDLLSDVVDKTPDRISFKSRELKHLSFADLSIADPSLKHSLAHRFELVYRDRLLSQQEIQIEIAEHESFNNN